MTPSPNAPGHDRRNPEKGVVVLIALVAVLVMALSATALLRSVQASVAVTGNLGFAQAAVTAADHAVEQAVATLFEQRLVADPSRDDPAYAYFASRQVAENARGVPLALQAPVNYPPGAPVLDTGNGNAVRFVIERMCLGPGPAGPDNCQLIPVNDPPLAIPNVITAEPPLVPAFRVSIRIDGPAAATQFVQAWLADIPDRRRLAWRALAE